MALAVDFKELFADRRSPGQVLLVTPDQQTVPGYLQRHVQDLADQVQVPVAAAENGQRGLRMIDGDASFHEGPPYWFCPLSRSMRNAIESSLKAGMVSSVMGKNSIVYWSF